MKKTLAGLSFFGGDGQNMGHSCPLNKRADGKMATRLSTFELAPSRHVQLACRTYICRFWHTHKHSIKASRKPKSLVSECRIKRIFVRCCFVVLLLSLLFCSVFLLFSCFLLETQQVVCAAWLSLSLQLGQCWVAIGVGLGAVLTNNA